MKKKYPTMPMFDVVNEAVGTHQKDNPMIKESLGGGGKTGFDWLIKAFEMAQGSRCVPSAAASSSWVAARCSLSNLLNTV